MILDTCRLCHQGSELRKSHIVPRFHKRRQRAIGEDRDGLVTINDGNLKTDQNPAGLWEYLLCGGCEKRINNWETYAANWFYNWDPIIAEEIPGCVLYKDLRFEEFRLYCLSVLWRMSVSSLPYYNRVDVGHSAAETLRIALIEGDPLEECWPVGFKKIVNPSGGDVALSVEPYSVLIDGKKSFYLLTNGFLHEFYMDSMGIDDGLLAQGCLSRAGTLAVARMPYPDHPVIGRAIRGQIKASKNNG